MNAEVPQIPVRTLASVPDGMQPMVLSRLVADRLKAAPDDPVSIVFVARDGRRMQRMAGNPRAALAGAPDPVAAGLGLSAL
jgi:transcription-repair coupling factor (superfamily II helicase)